MYDFWWVLAALAAFFAGLIDAVGGGGGLIQFPALLALYPSTPVAVLAGSNKLAAIAGTSFAMRSYARAVAVDLRALAPVAGAAFVGSLAGAAVLTRFPSEAMRSVAVVLLVLVAAYTVFKPDFGTHTDPDARLRLVVGVPLGAAIGFYDGFFGPGTGSFLVFAFVGLARMDFLRASASAKLVNVATNLAALAVLVPSGHIDVRLGLAMALCNVAGAAVGTRLALRQGAPLVRKVFLGVVSALLVRLAWDAIAR